MHTDLLALVHGVMAVASATTRMGMATTRMGMDVLGVLTLALSASTSTVP